MEASPSYGERPTMQGAFRRSFTVPARQLSFHEKAGLDQSDANADTLYSHPIARIISFSPPKESIKSTNKAEIPADTDYPIDTVETLPWRSRSEALIATGLMVIEKVRGSTNFLKCQEITHAILRNSQCWCVDGESKFVLRVRKFQYYRIELPSTTQEDKAKVEELKKVFPMVLRFECTPCPFIRAFTVDLPDDAITPRRKGQWKRRDSSQSNTPDTETPPLRIKKIERSWSSQTPPTSYPRNASAHNLDGDRGRSGGPAGIYRRRSLFENQRNSSPAGLAWNEDGTDSDHQGSGHDSELENTTDRSETSSPRKHLDNPPRKERIIAELSPDEAEIGLKESAKGPDVSIKATAFKEMQTHTEEPVAVSSGPALAAFSNDQEYDQPGSRKSNETVLPDTVSLTALSEVRDTVAPGTKFSEDQLPLDSRSQRTTGVDGALEVARVEKASQTRNTGSSAMIDDIVESDELYDTLLKEVSALPDSSEDGSPAQQVGALLLAMDDEFGSEETTFQNASSEAATSHGAQTDSHLYTLPNHFESGTDALVPSEPRSKTTGTAPTTMATDSLSLKSVNQNLELLTKETDLVTDEVEVDTEGNDDLSPVSSADSFHTLASTIHRDPLDDQLESDTTTIDKWQVPRSSIASRHKRDVSEVTVTASSDSEPASPKYNRTARQEHETTQGPSHLQSSASDTSWPGPDKPSVAPDQGSVRQRFKARKRSFSPLPPASTIFTGNQIRHDSGRGHMTKTILQKVVVKPIEVAILVIHILARIASGATVSDLLSGELFKRPDQQKALSDSTERPKDDKSGSDTEDDYGVPVRGRRRSSEMRMATVFDGEIADDFAEID